MSPTDTIGVSFDYSGAMNGSYRASGVPTRTNLDYMNSTSYGTVLTYGDTETLRVGTVSIIANDKNGEKYGNFLTLASVPARVGSSSLVTGGVYLGLVWNSSGFNSDSSLQFRSGDVALTVTESSPTRVRGTFSGKGYINGGRADRYLVNITNGTFNLSVNDTAAVYFRCRLFPCVP